MAGAATNGPAVGRRPRRHPDAEIAAGRVPPLAVVLPMGRDSWYVDDPDGAGPVHRAFTTDLVDAAERRHGIGGGRAARAVGGLSMGGYGAVLAALARPDAYAAAISLSGSLFPEMADGAPARPVHMFGRVFGDPFDRRRFNAWNVFVRLAAVPTPAALPAFWLQAGDDDFPAILDGTVRFHQALRRAGRRAHCASTTAAMPGRPGRGTSCRPCAGRAPGSAPCR